MTNILTVDPSSTKTITKAVAPITQQYLTTVGNAYKTVPWLYRGVNLRANSISRLPYGLYAPGGDEDVSATPKYAPVAKWIRRMLFNIELSKTLYGASYHLLEANKFNLNLTPRYIPTPNVSIKADYVRGVEGFILALTTGDSAVELKRMVWIWEPNAESEIEPGPAPAAVALKAAGALYAIDDMQARYFGGGAVPVTIALTPATVSEDDRQALEGWFNKMLAGWRNAWRLRTIRAAQPGQKAADMFAQVGANPKDTSAPELTQTQRDNVAVALGVPPSVIDGRSSDEANSRAEKMAFLTDTIIPEAELIREALNEQLFAKLGVELWFNYDELEIMQTAELQNAAALQALVGQPILSINEARESLEYDEVPGGSWEEQEAQRQEEAQLQRDALMARANQPPAGDAEPSAAKMAEWRKAALAAPGQAVGAPFDNELVSCHTKSEIRAVFESHWPQPETASLADAVRELKRYNDALA